MTPYHLAFALTPVTLRRIVDCVPVERHTDTLGPDRFNLVEMVAHMADWEDIFLDRMRLAHEFPGAPAEHHDESQRAIDKHYATRDIQHELDVFENRRRDTIDFLQSLKEEDFQKGFIHPEGGKLRTIQNQVMMMTGHDIYHFDQAAQYLREPVTSGGTAS